MNDLLILNATRRTQAVCPSGGVVMGQFPSIYKKKIDQLFDKGNFKD